MSKQAPMTGRWVEIPAGAGAVRVARCELDRSTLVMQTHGVSPNMPDGWIVLPPSFFRSVADEFDPLVPELLEQGITLDERQKETAQALVLHAQKYLPWTPDVHDLWSKLYGLGDYKNNEEAPHG